VAFSDMYPSAVKHTQAELSFPDLPSVTGNVKQKECRKRNKHTRSRPLKLLWGLRGVFGPFYIRAAYLDGLVYPRDAH
jgi:hypothetical protein